MVSKSPVIGVLGAGSWGTALSLVLARNGHEVTLWDIDAGQLRAIQTTRKNTKFLGDIEIPESILIETDINKVVSSCRDLLIVVPSHALRELLTQIKPHVMHDTRLILACKGLDPESGLLDHVVYDVLSKDTSIAVLSGPSFAREVAANKLTAVTIASKDEAFRHTLVALFNSHTFHVHAHEDVIGAEVGGSVKNVIAIASGAFDALGFGANARAALITHGLDEITRLGVALGAKPETFLGLSGMGDLVLTCSDSLSRNYRMGQALVQNPNVDAAQKAIGQVVEGVRNAKEIYQLAKKLDVHMPIVTQVYRMLYEGAKPQDLSFG